ncbi:MAG: DinB family protein [Candidatus Krumholzibacteriia bacterium]
MAPSTRGGTTLNRIHLVERLEINADAVRDLVRGVGPQQARWRPSAQQWSLLEVICHLRDEEKDDFRARIEATLFRPDEPWTPIDPRSWPKSRKYHQQDLGEALHAFMGQRCRSVGWLRGLGETDWTRAHHHPQFGPLRAGDLLVSWVAHDYLHLRQLTRLHYLYNLERAGGFQAGYAGEW